MYPTGTRVTVQSVNHLTKPDRICQVTAHPRHTALAAFRYID